MGMTREQFATLAKAMKAVYTKPEFMPDKDAFDVWYSLLQDLEYPMASKALQRYMNTQKFPPTVADIREQYTNLTEGMAMNGMEAWALVSKALRNSTYHAQEEFDALPDAVKRAVGSASQLRFMASSENYNEDVARSNFLRSYQATSKWSREELTVQPNVRMLVQDVMAQLPGCE